MYLKKQLKSRLKGGKHLKMDKNSGPFSWLKKLLKNDEKPDKKMGKYQYMILVLCIGAAFMLVSNIVFKSNTSTMDTPVTKTVKQDSGNVAAFGFNKSGDNPEITNYEKKYETELTKALEEMLGVNDVTVLVSIDSTDQKVLEKNKSTKTQTTEETDKQGGQRKVQESSTDEQLVITRNGDQEGPIVIETKKPEIRGVWIVAKGAENIEVKKWIVEAVTRVLGVPSYKVAVTPKK
jgi:stage III sporulation protein AG